MAWSKLQRQIAAMACRHAGLDEADRRTLLRQLPNARKVEPPSSRAPDLTQGEFETFMARVEWIAGGKLPRYSAWYWQDQVGGDGTLKRMRYLVRCIATTLELNHNADGEPLLAPDGVGLAGWISKRVTGGRTSRLEQLNQSELKALILGLRDHGTRHGVTWRASGRAQIEGALLA